MAARKIFEPDTLRSETRWSYTYMIMLHVPVCFSFIYTGTKYRVHSHKLKSNTWLAKWKLLINIPGFKLFAKCSFYNQQLVTNLTNLT